MWIICSGDVVEGFDFIGPFKTQDEATQYAITLDHRDYRYAKLMAPLVEELRR